MKRLLRFWNCQNGFSLVEMALVLAIIGTVAGLSLPILIQSLETNRLKTTHERLNHLRDVIGLYVARMKLLPCPSPSPDDGLIGQQCKTGNISAHKGYIPFRTLGIPHKMTLDGFGHPIHMAIDLSVMDKQYSFIDPLPSQLTLRTERDTPLLSADSPDPLALILFSEGTGFSQPPQPLEAINMNDSPHYIDAPLSHAKHNLHRHMLVWSTFEHLFFLHGRGERIKNPIDHSHVFTRPSTSTAGTRANGPTTPPPISAPSATDQIFE